MICDLCGTETEVAGRGLPIFWRPATIAGKRHAFCEDCCRVMSSLDDGAKATARKCLHLLACEAERFAEWVLYSGPLGPEVAPPDRARCRDVVRAVRQRITVSAFREACACPDCGLVRAGARREVWGDASERETRALLPVGCFVVPEVWGEAVDMKTGEVTEPEEPARLEGETREEMVDRHRRETRSGQYATGPKPGGLTARAAAKRPRRPHEWRFPEEHRYTPLPSLGYPHTTDEAAE